MQTAECKRVLITGASEGIGRSLAIRLAGRGYGVTAVARDEGRLQKLMSELRALSIEGGSSPKHHWIAADLSKNTGRSKVVQELSSSAGEPYSLLINNAGIGSVGSYATLPIETHLGLVELNIIAPLELTHAFLQRARQGDGIIQVSSVLSMTPLPAQPVYSATKAFLTSFSESLWFQCRSKGIRVFNLCPGITRTGFTLKAGGDPKGFPDAFVETPDEVANYALEAFFSGQGPTGVSGWRNRLSTFLSRFKSRKGLVELMGKFEA